jgi:probable phosphoglycerate mutase
MQRCRDTGDEIARQCGVRTEVLQYLHDLDYGDWQWQTHAAITARSPDLFKRWQAWPE